MLTQNIESAMLEKLSESGSRETPKRGAEVFERIN